MKTEEKEKHIIGVNATILEALEKLNSLSGGEMTLAVVDSDGRMKGSLTDGDIRRGLLKGIDIAAPVSEVMFKTFRALDSENKDISKLKEIRDLGISLVPSLDAEGRIADFIDTTETLTKLPLSAVLMAGGKGERLRPLTLSTPKPLLPIQGKPIIDYNIDLLNLYGISDIWVTVNYMAEQIESHFEGSQVNTVRENKFLGTIGSVSLIDLPEKGDTLVMNADLLTTISIEDMYLRHMSENADVTIAAIPYNVSVPYAILSTDSSSVTGIEEKPSYSYFANAGIYIFSNAVLSTLTSDTRTDATDLIEQVIAGGGKVTFYPINGTWIDIGSPVDFSHAQELMRHISNLNRHRI